MLSAAKSLAALLCCVLCVDGRAQTVASPASTPAETAGSGFSHDRLQRLDRFMQDATQAGGYLGAVTLVARNGEVVQLRAYGQRDLARTSPMRRDSIFRIYSMTKTVATVAALILMEEGKLALDDPVADYLPEFAGLQLFTGGTADAPQLRPATRTLTIRHLLTHTAGFATGGEGAQEAVKLLERKHLHGSRDLQQFAERLATVPLAAEPGTRFVYDGTQMELASRIVEVVSGQRFDRFLHERILGPLRMFDTGFGVAAADRDRIVDITTIGAGGLVLDQGPSARHPGQRLNPYFSGAGGLYSTASDFWRFAQMLLEGGTLDGVSILGRKTVEAMMANQLTQLDPPVTQFSAAEGFGLGGAILLDPARRGRLGSVGQYGWSGAASTYFTIDPKERLVAIVLLQHLPNDADHDLPRISTRFYNLVYQALE